MEWEPWSYAPTIPALGDYVQVKEHPLCGKRVVEGTVVYTSCYGFRIAPVPDIMHIACWRRGILPEKDKKVRKKEKVA